MSPPGEAQSTSRDEELPAVLSTQAAGAAGLGWGAVSPVQRPPWVPVTASSPWTARAGPVTGPLRVCEFMKEAEWLKDTRPMAGGWGGAAAGKGEGGTGAWGQAGGAGGRERW